MISYFRAFWAKLDDREQKLLKITTPIVILMLFYLMLWVPLQIWQEKKLKISQQYQQIEQNLLNILIPKQKLKINQWLDLVKNYDLENIEISQEGDVFILKAIARNLESTQELMNAIAERGGYWRLLEIESNPIKIKIEWIII